MSLVEQRLTVLEQKSQSDNEALKNISNTLISIQANQQEFASQVLKGQEEILKEQSLLRNDQAMLRKDFVQAKEEFGFKLELNHKLVANYRASIGQGIEKLSAQWITKILEARDFTNPPVRTRVKFADPEGIVNPKNFEVEVDVYCETPLVIAECKTIVFPKDLDDIHKFIKVRDFVCQGRKCDAFFVTYGFHYDIKKKALELLEQNGIEPIDAAIHLS